MDAITVGLDIAKSVFHVHVVDGSGKVLHSKKLRRSQVEPFFTRLPRAVVGIEACATAHYWARVLRREAGGHGEFSVVIPLLSSRLFVCGPWY